jgi:CMP-N-acetylneuraminic acid synthetase
MIRPNSFPCIIPARGGSKSIPRKNIITIGGKPLIVWSIEAAHAAQSISDVYVSTEDEEIASVAISAGAKIIWRPIELAGDETSSEDVLINALEHLADLEISLPEIFLFMQCTSPLTAAGDIDGIANLLVENNVDSVIAVVSGNYFLWHRKTTGLALPVNHDPRQRPRRQDRTPEYLETGAVYAIRTKTFLRDRSRFGSSSLLYEIPRHRSIDIDDPEDLELVELLLKARFTEDLNKS